MAGPLKDRPGGAFAGGGPHPRFGFFFHVAIFDENSRVFSYDLRDAAGTSPEAWPPLRHGLKEDQAEALFLARHREKMAACKILAQFRVAPIAGELHRIPHSDPLGERLQARKSVPATDDA